MSLIVVRDDDANATTDPDRLAAAYAPLLDSGVVVNFSVIPEVNLCTRAPDGRRERFIDPAWPDRSLCAELAEQTPLARWLRRHRGAVDVFMHGLSHARRRSGFEFAGMSRAESAAMLYKGIRIMEQSLGWVPLGFVAPWDAFSSGALSAACAAFDLVSAGWVNVSRLPPSAWPSHFSERVAADGLVRSQRAWILRHRGCRITGQTRPQDVPSVVSDLVSDAEIGVIVLHHWMFYDGTVPPPVVVALAQALRPHTTLNIRSAINHLDSLPWWYPAQRLTRSLRLARFTQRGWEK